MICTTISGTTMIKLARAISVFTGSSFLGTGVALLGGGLLIAAMTEIGEVTLPVVGTLKPWQLTFIAVSIPSFASYF